MKKVIFSILFLFCGIISSLFAKPVSAATDGSQIKYFGYYWGFPGISRNGLYVNALFVEKGAPESGNFGRDFAYSNIETLNQLDSYGVKGILDLTALFFVPNDPANPWMNYSLRFDWQTRWSQFWTTISPHKNKILAFYPIDEVNEKLTRAPYEMAIGRIKADAPDIPIIELFDGKGVYELHEGQSAVGVPPAVDWLAMDEYHCWNNGGSCYGGMSVQDKINYLHHLALTSVSVNGQPRHIILVPDAYVPASSIPANFDAVQQNLASLNQGYYNLCKGLSQCIGLFPFVWITDFNQGLLGVQDMPVLENYLKTNIASKITGKSGTASPLPTVPSIFLPIPGDINQDGHVNILDLRAFSASFTNISAYSQMVTNYGK